MVTPGLVEGRVEVTKRGGAGVFVALACVETSTQEVIKRMRVIKVTLLLCMG